MCSSFRWDFVANAATVCVRVNPTTAKYRFIVDGVYVDLAGTNTNATSGSSEYIKLDFTAVGGKASRHITVEGQLTGGPGQVWVEAGGTITRVSSAPKKIAFAGDSFTYGSAAVDFADNYAWVTADTLGFAYSLNSGNPGTGYVATGGGVNYKLFDRITDITSQGPHDVIVIAMGVNDLSQGASADSVRAEVSKCVTALRMADQKAQIFVLGGFDVNAPSAPAAGYADLNAAIQAGIPGGCGATYLDPGGIAYTHGDAVHPDTAGHATLGLWLAGQIKTALGA
jgi:lysophospholipase L1-like esterase